MSLRHSRPPGVSEIFSHLVSKAENGCFPQQAHPRRMAKIIDPKHLKAFRKNSSSCIGVAAAIGSLTPWTVRKIEHLETESLHAG